MSNSSSVQPIVQLSVQDFEHRRQDTDSPLQLIDVREPEELAMSKLNGFMNLPLSQFSAWSDRICVQFDPDVETVVMCHHGMRSAQMCLWLMQQGFSNVKNLQGGIDAYARYVDSSVPLY